jgi:RsiW-degrading membrane proteinase PrsW (M82 family)
MLLLGILFPKGFDKFHVKLFIAFFTGTAGIALLFIIQGMAAGPSAAGGGPVGVIFAIIGMSYDISDQQNIPFSQLLIANIIGVGLCEELIKVLPVFVILLGRKRLRWYECCSLGMASGLGFGLVEAVDYGQMYNGLQDQLTYWIRFVSCVISHGISTAAAVLFLHRFQSLLHGDMTWLDFFLRLLILISIPMCLHGLYNTFASKNMDGLALATDLFNFGWMALLIETARDKEGDMTIIVSQEEPKPTATLTPQQPSNVGQPFWISTTNQHHLGHH